MWDVRKNGNEICFDVYFCPYLEMSLLEFGGSPTHCVIHIGCFIVDLANRRETQVHSKRGFKEIHIQTEQLVHDEILGLLGIHVGEVRAGGAGNSKSKIC